MCVTDVLRLAHPEQLGVAGAGKFVAGRDALADEGLLDVLQSIDFAFGVGDQTLNIASGDIPPATPRHDQIIERVNRRPVLIIGTVGRRPMAERQVIIEQRIVEGWVVLLGHPRLSDRMQRVEIGECGVATRCR